MKEVHTSLDRVYRRKPRDWGTEGPPMTKPPLRGMARAGPPS